MFGIDFPELVIIAVVALIVIGPEHLPKVARTMGHLWGRAQRYINGIKSDMSRDLALEELRKMQKEAQLGAANFEVSMQNASQEVGKQVHEFENEISGSKYELGRSIPANEIATNILPQSELLKSEHPEKDEAAASEPSQSELPRHQAVEEHHAVMPESAELKKPT